MRTPDRLIAGIAAVAAAVMLFAAAPAHARCGWNGCYGYNYGYSYGYQYAQPYYAQPYYPQPQYYQQAQYYQPAPYYQQPQYYQQPAYAAPAAPTSGSFGFGIGFSWSGGAPSQPYYSQPAYAAPAAYAPPVAAESYAAPAGPMAAPYGGPPARYYDRPRWHRPVVYAPVYHSYRGYHPYRVYRPYRMYHHHVGWRAPVVVVTRYRRPGARFMAPAPYAPRPGRVLEPPH